MTVFPTAFRLSAVLAVALVLGGPLPAQEAGLDAIARPDAAGTSVMRFTLDARARATRIDGETATRVYGGRPARDGAWPHQVALVATQAATDGQGGFSYSQFCGGSLIARQWVLTAAHCVFDERGNVTDPASIMVLTGSNDLDKGDLRAVARIIPHEAYDPIVIDNDLALIKLAEPIQQSNGPVGAIPVLQAGQPLPLGPAVVVGWGLIQGDVLPDTLMETDIDIVSNETCNRGMAEQTKRDFGMFLNNMGIPNRIPKAKLEEAYQILVGNLGNALSDNMICAGIATGERTSCNGDSGGPLMIRQADGKWLQVGVVSWGRVPLDTNQRCGHAELYAVFTRLSNYYDWIADKIRTQ